MKIRTQLLCLFISMIISCVAQESTTIYESENLRIEQLTANTFIHISYLDTKNYGKVPCNGMVVTEDGEAIVFDTPTNDSASIELIDWFEKNANSQVKAVVVTHFHTDCLGGLKGFHSSEIPSYANNTTISLAKSNNVTVPQNGFNEYLEIPIGNKLVLNEFMGEGHTKDNIVCYFPSERVLFGGCLIKADGAGKGNLNDANIKEWSNSVGKIKIKYNDLEVVIPGHGKAGGVNLLDFTIELFNEKD